MSDVRLSITPAATKIIRYVETLLKPIGVPVEAQPIGYVPHELFAHVNVAVVDDTVFDQWSSFDSEGRTLEIDIEVRCKINGVAYTEAKAIASSIEKLMTANRGQHVVDGGSVVAERVGEPVDPTRDGEATTVLLPIQYSMLHRIPRGIPDVIKP